MVKCQWVYYGRMSVSVLWLDVSECIMVDVSECIMMGCH